jgi:hypothetical protein
VKLFKDGDLRDVSARTTGARAGARLDATLSGILQEPALLLRAVDLDGFGSARQDEPHCL